jgi:hypothetical protein
VVIGVTVSTIGIVFCIGGVICRLCVCDRFYIFCLICFIIVFGVGIVGAIVFEGYFAGCSVLCVFYKY